jgi:hypothetical protein
VTGETLARVLVAAVEVYLGAGLLLALAFVTRGVAVVDPRARGSSWGFRLAILPGTAALWPLLLRRWWRRQEPPEERNAHRVAAREAARNEEADPDGRGQAPPLHPRNPVSSAVGSGPAPARPQRPGNPAVGGRGR